MALALKSNVYSDVYITGNCIVTGTMTTLANPVNSLMTILQDQKTSGTNGGSSITGWQTRTLNTAVLDQIGVNLTTNQFTLPAGTYHVQISTPATQVNNHRCRLYNVTTSSTILLGTSEIAQQTTPGNMTNRSFIDAYFTSGASGTYRVDHYCTAVQSGNGLGSNASSGDSEIYTTVKIIKINSGAALNQWTTGGTSLFYNSGNVGVGTTSPSQINAVGSLIHVYDSGTNAATVRVDSTGGTGQARLHLSAGNGANYRASRLDFFNFPTSATVPTNTLISDYDQNGTNNFDLVNFSGARTLTIKQSGNVGIGSITPLVKLDVAGAARTLAPAANGVGNWSLAVTTGSGTSSMNAAVSFYSTFYNYPSDMGQRRTADILAGYSTGVWGTEYLAFRVGQNGASNDAENLGIERLRITGDGFINIATVRSFSAVSTFDTIPFDLVNYNVVEIRMTFYFSHTASGFTMSAQMLDTAGTVYTPTETGWQAWAAAGTSSASGTGANIFGAGITRIQEFVGGYTAIIRLTGNMALAQSVRNHLEWSAVGCYASVGASLVLGRCMYQNTSFVTMNRLRFTMNAGTITGKYSILHYNN